MNRLVVKRQLQPLFSDFNTLFGEFNRLNHELDRTIWGATRPALTWDVDAERVVIRAELPGIDPAALDITLDAQQVLTIKGERADDTPADGATFLRRERQFGNFARTFHLPYRVDDAAIDAAYLNGVLTLTLTRAAADKPRQIAIKVN